MVMELAARAVEDGPASGFVWAMVLNETSKLLVARSYQVDLLALAAMVQSRRAGNLRGFDEVAAQMRRWSSELHHELGALRELGRELVALVSEMTKHERLVGLLERARADRDGPALAATIAARRAEQDELDASLARLRRRLLDRIHDLNQLGMMASVLSRSAMIEAAAAAAGQRAQLAGVSHEFHRNAEWVIAELQHLLRRSR